MLHLYLWLGWAREHFLVCFLALAVAVVGGRPLLRVTQLPLQAMRRLARHPRTSLLVIFLAAIALRLSLLPILGVPLPRVHDEFSYLLAADTFASGRLSNPTPPLWTHFETFHVNFQPTYGSMYPPAQGMLMGLAQALTGEPWLGVLLSAAAMCAAIAWMLRGWMSASWAFAGGLIAVAHYCTNHYWINSYWGGALPALGGALLLGAAPRIARQANPRHALVGAIGVAILANSRPFEGAVLTAAVGVALAARWVNAKAALPLWPTLKPATVVLILTAFSMGYYFWRTTGCPFRMPYQLNVERYHTVSPLLLAHDPPPPAAYRYKVMQDYYTLWERNYWAPPVNSLATYWALLQQHLHLYYEEFVQPWVLLFLVGLGFAVLSRKYLLLLSLGSSVAALAAERWAHAHYAAPIAGLIIALHIWGLRTLRLWQFRTRLGMRWSNAILVLAIPALLLANIAGIASDYRNPPPAEPWYLARARILRQLQATPGQHLVLVRYGNLHNVHAEWVYNRANIEAAKVIWAREQSPAEDRKLLDYFKGRQVWVVYGDDVPPRLQPYVPALSRSSRE
jgi:hypothetical protein